MNRALNLTLALTAGMLGGLLSHYLAPISVHAQAQPAAPKDIRAQSFVVVDVNNNVVGTFRASEGRQPGRAPSVVLLDPDGRELWRGGGATVRPLITR